MTQLTYNEAFDPYHAAFRLFRIHLACDLSTASAFDTVRILDFYLLFPFRLQNMRLYTQDTAWRAVSKSYLKVAPYGHLPDDNSIFSRMEPFQRAAAASLAHCGYITLEAWNRNEIAFSDMPLPAKLQERCRELNEATGDIVSILCAIRTRYPLAGRNGLKDRTGLLEFRYDPL